MHHRFIVFVLLGSVALWGCGSGSETVIPEPSGPVDLLDTPFTVEQIRDEWVEGLTLLMHTTSPSNDAFERWTVLSADESGAEIEFLQVDTEGNPAGPPRRVGMTWETLRSHGAFPKAMANREEMVRDTALGQLDGWLYSVRDEQGGLTEFFFAKSLPGAPIQMKVTKDGTRIMELAQVERTRPDDTGKEPEGGQDPAAEPATPPVAETAPST